MKQHKKQKYSHFSVFMKWQSSWEGHALLGHQLNKHCYRRGDNGFDYNLVAGLKVSDNNGITVDGMGALCMGLIIICLPECGWPETSLKLEEKFDPCKRKLLPCPDDGGGYNAVKTQCRDDPEMEESAGTFVLFFPGLC